MSFTLLLALILGALDVYQFVLAVIERKMRGVYTKNVIAARNSLVALRAMCTEAANDPTKVDSVEKGQTLASHVAYFALSIENTLGAILPEKKE